MVAKFILFACLVAFARAGDLLQQHLIAAPAPISQIRYAPAAPLISKSTIIHTQAPAVAYHAPAPAVVAAPQLVKTIAPAPAAIAYHAPAPIAYHAPAPIAYQAQAPAIAYHASAPAALAYQAPAAYAYHQAPAIRAIAPAPLIRTIAPAPFVRAVAPAPLIKTVAAAPLLKTVAPAALIKAQPVEEYDPNPQYSFGYDVQDSLTGDIKSQSETRNGDTVQGSYALNEPDGTRRIVDYSADPVNGFNAIVRREPLEQKAIIAPVAKLAPAPVAYAPALKIATPVAKLAYGEPAPALIAH